MGTPNMPKSSRGVVRSSSDIAQEKRDEYDKKKARMQTLLSQQAPAGGEAAGKKTLLGG